MASFSKFLESFNDDNSKGEQFEKFLKVYFTTYPKWSNQLKNVWLWSEEDNPHRWQEEDLGTDLIAETHSGEIWAIQSKNYNPDKTLKLSDFSTFLGDTSRKEVDRRLLVSTTKSITNNAKKTIRGQEKPIDVLLYDEFSESDFNFPDTFDGLFKPIERISYEPRSHQKDAIDNVVKGFKSSDRGQLIMACGTGKTFTTLWIKEALDANSTLILLPSLSLLSQTLNEWYKACSQPFEALCVCSDSSVTRGVDEIVGSVDEIHFPTTTQPVEIKKFLSRDARKVVFSTYQSSPMIAEVFKDKSIKPFDLAIADEAHRCTGDTTSDFTTIVDNKKIRASKRLYATATPKTFSKRVHSQAKIRDIEIADMSDETKFGSVFHKLSFAQAISYEPKPLLNDYKVVVIGVTEPMIADLISERELLKLNENENIDAYSLASQIGLLKAIHKFDLTKMISFHSNISLADKFAGTLHKVLDILPNSDKSNKLLTADMVSGNTPTSVRNQKLKQLKLASKDEVRILTNARCLSEGVDVPNLDSVAFINPRKSQVDIIQGVGRAIRTSDDSDYGYIILPIFIENKDLAEETINKTKFKAIWDILNALKSHDEDLEIQLNEIRTSMGRKNISLGGDTLSDKVTFDLPIEVSESFKSSLKTLVVENSTQSWNYYFGVLQDYTQENNSSRVPGKYITESGVKLGIWVDSQRQRKFRLNNEQIEKLESLPQWSWNPHLDSWNLGYAELVKYADEYGNASPRFDYVTTEDFKLGQWVVSQRTKKATLEEELVQLLEDLEGWSWNTRDTQWDNMYQSLKDYSEVNNHSRPPNRYIHNNLNIGSWVARIRQRPDKVSDSQKLLLESLPGWSWTLTDDEWKEKFNRLLVYIDRFNNASPTFSYIDETGFALGKWVQRQRLAGNKGKLGEKYILFDNLKGWSWDPFKDKWLSFFQLLQNYVNEFNTLPLSSYKTSDGKSLGAWVSKQRNRKDQLDKEYINFLESIDCWVWDTDTWEAFYEKLLEFFLVKNSSLTNSTEYKNVKIGQWAKRQRASMKEGKLSQEKIDKLEALENWKW